MTFYECSITLDFDSGEDFCGIGIFCRFFALKDFLSYKPLKKVWADRPTAVRFRVKQEKLLGGGKGNGGVGGGGVSIQPTWDQSGREFAP